MKTETERIERLTMTFDREDIRRALSLYAVFEYAYTPKALGEMRDCGDGTIELVYAIDPRDKPCPRSSLFDDMVDVDDGVVCLDDETPEGWAHRIYESIRNTLCVLKSRAATAQESD